MPEPGRDFAKVWPGRDFNALRTHLVPDWAKVWEMLFRLKLGQWPHKSTANSTSVALLCSDWFRPEGKQRIQIKYCGTVIAEDIKTGRQEKIRIAESDRPGRLLYNYETFPDQVQTNKIARKLTRSDWGNSRETLRSSWYGYRHTTTTITNIKETLNNKYHNKCIGELSIIRFCSVARHI